ncbi:glycosyltransferase family 25 protein [Luteolibacter algae]|uniref:Glycosyltransferase family 25 protein n=1 Tax=Luteolibacter algae TaxID=454151 RepID=A0ABW5D9P0_9BACT
MTDSTVDSAPAKLVDGVVVINLVHRPERLERFASQAAEIPSFSGWERIPAVDGSLLSSYGKLPWFRGRKRDKAWGGRAGCTLSHRNAIRTAKKNGWKSVLVFEDDVNLGNDPETLEKRVFNAMHSQGDDWQILYLGSSEVIGPCHLLGELEGARALYETQGCIGAFAYIVKDEAYDWILERLPEQEDVWKWISRHRAIDRWFARNLRPTFNVRCVFPSLIGHFSTFSDIGQRAAANIHTEASDEHVQKSIEVRGRTGFALRCIVQRIRFAAADLGNRFRSLNKRLRGF